MEKTKFISAKEAVDMIQDGSTLCAIGITLVSACETILKEIEQTFLTTGRPKDLTFVHPSSHSDRVGGKQHLAHEGLVKRVIGGHWGLSPKWMDLIVGNRVEAFNLPQGQLANLFHSMALREPGKVSEIGLGTYIDPRQEGGKMNPRTKECGHDTVELTTVDGKEYIRYKPIPIDTLLIRGTYADENGNISTEEEAMMLEVLPAVLATKRFNGKVICQVKQVVKANTLDPKRVTVPGVFVDAVVVCDNPQVDHRQTSSWFYDPTYSGQAWAPESQVAPIPLTERKVIGRRASMLLEKGSILNVGTGIPNDVIGNVIAEEGISDDVMLTVETGIYGGIPSGGVDFGIAQNPQAIIPHDRQFEYYNGTGVDITFMGAGEMDKYGNVNATKMGDRAPGCGGFIDITTMAKTVVFCSTFTGRGLKVSFEGSKLNIDQEGKIKKMVDQVQQISYNGLLGVERGQKMFFITERAVFQMTAKGPMLIEIAPGVDLQKDILDQMEFTPLISDNLAVSPSFLFEEQPFGLKDMI